MLSDFEIRSEFQDNYRYAEDYWAPFVKDAQVYSLAAAGYTWSDEERRQLQLEGREPLEYNLTRRPLQFYSGYLRDNINEVIYSPIEGSDQKTADQFTKIGYYIWDKGQGFPVFLDAADECMKSGISLCGIQMDYSRDFIEGDISFYKRTYNSFYLDPTFESLNLSDCSFGITRDLLGKEAIKMLLPMVDPKIIDEVSFGFRDDKFVQYHPQFTTFNRNRNLIAYDQYYKKTTRERKFLVDRNSSYYRDITDLSKEEIDKLKIAIRRFQQMKEDPEIDPMNVPNIEIRNFQVPFVELNVMLNQERVYCGEDHTGITHTYPFVPLLFYFEPSIWMPSLRIQGLPSTVWSLNRNFNKRHMKIIDMMDSEISTGFKYLIGSVPDTSDLMQSGQSKIIGVDPENAPQGLDSVQQLQGGGANPALIQYQDILDKLSLTLSNINESILGIDDKGNTQVSGRLAEVRIAQGLRGNRKFFDQIETSQQLLGSLILTAIQKNYSPGKVERIIAEKPTEQFYNSEFEQYDAVIKAGVRSKTQKDAYYYELVNLKREGIVDVPESEIVRALQMSGVSELREAIEKQEQMKAQQMAMLQEKERISIDLDNAQKEQMLALAQERRARVISDVSLAQERSSEAEQNRAQAALDRAKTITEIASLSDDRILKVLEFVNMLERQEMADRDMVTQNIHAQADQINSETQGSAENQQAQAAMQQQQMQQNIMSDFNQGG